MSDPSYILTLVAKFSHTCSILKPSDPELVNIVAEIIRTGSSNHDVFAAIHAIPFRARTILYCISNSIETGVYLKNIRLCVKPDGTIYSKPVERTALPYITQSVRALGCFFTRISNAVVTTVNNTHDGFLWVMRHIPSKADIRRV